MFILLSIKHKADKTYSPVFHLVGSPSDASNSLVISELLSLVWESLAQFAAYFHSIEQEETSH